MGANPLSALEDQPVGGAEHPRPREDAGRHSSDRGVQMQDPGDDGLFRRSSDFRHGSLATLNHEHV